MENINDLFRSGFTKDKIIKLNTKFNKVAIQYIYWNIFNIKPKLSDIKIDDKKSTLYIYGKKILCWDKHHHFCKKDALMYANYLYLSSVEDTLIHEYKSDSSNG